MGQPVPPVPDPSPEVRQLNLDIADRVKQLSTEDLASVLSGRASTLLRADDNQNQNQGARELAQ
jgi:hypothetical protein